MTSISADDTFGHIAQPTRVPSARRRKLRRIRTELTMIGIGLSFTLFAVGYGISHL